MTNINNKLTSIYKNSPKPLKATVWFTITSFLQRGIGILTGPIFTRIMTKDSYGIYTTFVACESVATVVFTFTLYRSLVYIYTRRTDKEKVLSSLMSLSLLMMVLWFIILMPFSDHIALFLRLPIMAIPCLIIYAGFSTVNNCWVQQENYQFSYFGVVIYTLVSTALTSVISMFVVIFYKGSQAEARIIVTTAITVVIGIFIYFISLIKGKCFFDKEVWEYAVTFCGVLLPHYLSDFILSSSDKIMINNICGSSDTAVYGVAYSVGMLIMLFANAINSSFAPYQLQMIKSGEYERLREITGSVFKIIAFMEILIMLYSKEIVYVFGGTRYIEAGRTVIPISAGVFFYFLFQIFARVQEFYNKKRNMVFISVICACINVLLNSILIPIIGYIAASFTTCFCYILFCLFHYISYKKICDKYQSGKTIYNIKELCLISLVVFCSGIVIFFLIDYLVVRISISVGLLIFIIIKKSYWVDIYKGLISNT